MRRPLAALAALCLSAPAARALEVDVELALLVDVSRSMDYEEQVLQRNGYVAAFRDDEVIATLTSGGTGRVAVAYIEWAGDGAARTLVDWTLIDGREAAVAFSFALARAEVSALRGTSIAAALLYGARSIEENGFQGLKRVIDVSGDGPNNIGPPVEEARDSVLARGISINGLPVMLKRPDGIFSIPDLDAYYRACVVGGPGAFVLPVHSPEELADTIRRKLILEVAGGPVWPAGPEAPRAIPAQLGLPQPGARQAYDCMVGEALRRRWMHETEF